MPRSELDEAARKLREMLLGEEPLSRREEPEPVHPLIVMCQRWLFAIKTQDAPRAAIASQQLAEMLTGFIQRPTIQQAVRSFQFAHPLSQENIPALRRIIEHIQHAETGF